MTTAPVVTEAPAVTTGKVTTAEVTDAPTPPAGTAEVTQASTTEKSGESGGCGSVTVGATAALVSLAAIFGTALVKRKTDCR